MTIAFRFDVSPELGTGHFMRCMTLAESLLQYPLPICLFCRTLPDKYVAIAAERGIKTYFLPEIINENSVIADAQATIAVIKKIKQPIHWMITDQYELDVHWERAIRPYVNKILVIDDFADQPRDCDLLFSQNYPTLNYDGLVPEHTTVCCGLKYVLLRKEFYKARQQLRQRDGVIRRILVSFGGSDPTRSTLPCLQMLAQYCPSQIKIDVTCGVLNPDRAAIQMQCERSNNMYYHGHSDKMAELITQADLALGSGGATHWERCFLGLPAIVNIVAENQKRVSVALAAHGAVINIRENDNTAFRDAFLLCLNDPERIKTMSAACLQLMPFADDAKGGADLIADQMYDNSSPHLS